MSEGVASVSQSAAALPTLAILRARVNAVLRNTDMTFIEPWFIDQLLNEGYLDLNARLRIKHTLLEATASSTGTITLPTDLVEIINIWFGSSPAVIVDDDVWLSYKNPAVSTAYDQYGQPLILARVVGGLTVETYPAQESVDYDLEYVSRPTEMVSDSDTPSALTQELVPRIVNYARAHAMWQDGMETEGAKYMAMYEQGLPGAPRDTFKHRPFSMTLIPEAGPFD